MSVDTSIQYNGYNSYKFIQGETLNCYPFGVENMSHITHSFGAYSPIALASAVRANTKFFDADSEILQSVDHSFSIGAGIFEDKSITVEVPAGATKAQLTFKNPVTNTWWVATPKTEEGQTATPYAINAYGQLTYITPNGIYTGILTAEQIVLASNENLSDRLTTINANQFTMQSGVDSLNANAVKKGVTYAGTKITAEDGFENTATIGGHTVKVKLNATDGLGVYSDDVFIGGITVVGGEIGLMAKRIGINATYYGEIGITDGNVGLGLFNRNKSAEPFVKMISLLDGAGFALIDKNEIQRLTLGGTTTQIRHANDKVVFQANDTATQIRHANGKAIFQATGNSFTLYDVNENKRYISDSNGMWLQSPNEKTYIIITDTFIRVVVNGVTKETWS